MHEGQRSLPRHCTGKGPQKPSQPSQDPCLHLHPPPGGLIDIAQVPTPWGCRLVCLLVPRRALRHRVIQGRKLLPPPPCGFESKCLTSSQQVAKACGGQDMQSCRPGPGSVHIDSAQSHWQDQLWPYLPAREAGKHGLKGSGRRGRGLVLNWPRLPHRVSRRCHPCRRFPHVFAWAPLHARKGPFISRIFHKVG